jgi:hypothetical protein
MSHFSSQRERRERQESEEKLQEEEAKHEATSRNGNKTKLFILKEMRRKPPIGKRIFPHVWHALLSSYFEKHTYQQFESDEAIAPPVPNNLPLL